MLLAATALSIALIAFAQAPPAPKTYLQRVYSEGETLHFNLSWLKIAGGSATMTVRPTEGVIRLKSLAQSNNFFSRIYPVRDEIESTVESGTFSTVRFVKRLDERSDRELEVTVIDYERGVALRKGREIPVTRPIFDPLSSIYHIRSLDLTVGRKHYFTVLADDNVFRMEALVLRKEIIKTDAGSFPTILVEPKMLRGNGLRDEKKHQLLIWYSDDERRIPVRIVTKIPAGSVTATLRTFKLGPDP